MPTGEVISISTESATQLAESLGSIGQWLQAIGVLALIWIIFQIISFIISRKRTKILEKIQNDLHKIEKQFERLKKKR